MAKTEKSVDGIIEKLALITDATQSIFPEGKTAIMFELNSDDFKKVLSNFRQMDQGHKRFKIDLSGVEMYFMLEGEYETPVINEQPVKKNLFKRLFPFISSKFSVKN
jgi:hypothetical protein